MRGFCVIPYCQTVDMFTVDDDASTGGPDFDGEMVPISAVQRLDELLRPPKIITSFPRGPGAQP